MSFVAALIALLLDQIRPSHHASWIDRAWRAWVSFLMHMGDTGKPAHARVLAFIAVLVPAVLAWGIEYLLWRLNPSLAWLWSVVVLYAVLGFRHFSHGFTAVKSALEARNAAEARTAYESWLGPLPVETSADQIAHMAASHGIVSSHRKVIAPLLAFAVLPGVGGAVLYRALDAALHLRGSAEHSAAYRDVLERVFFWIDSALARASAAGFCAVGHFEEAAVAWRQWTLQRVSSSAWLLGVSLGALALRSESAERAEFGVQAADFGVAHLAQVVGLVWRSVVLWMALFALMQFAAVARAL
jgi:adenosylcobinamide-phosphate synthase